MAFISSGVLVKSPTTLWSGTTDDPSWPAALSTSDAESLIAAHAYAFMYQSQPWIATVVNKLAKAHARLPLKVYERSDRGRLDGSQSPYGRLLRSPSRTMAPKLFWLWVASTVEIEGEAFLYKDRNQLGVPVGLRPVHPTKVVNRRDPGTSEMLWFIRNGGAETPVRRSDLVHFRTFAPGTVHRGMSALEPLRSTLENEYGARRANNALWRRGASPSVTLRHPGRLKNQNVLDKLRDQWNETHGGVDNWAKPLILEEGMEADFHPNDLEALEFIDSRKLNREEVCAVYDVPPPVVHILDRATFSNITEQMRSMYRDTMAPRLAVFESVLDHELRDGRMGERRDPDFGDDYYAEHLMDEVLRGAFEARVQAMAQAIQTGQMTPAEARELENRPYVEGSDVLFVNGAVVPVSEAAGTGEAAAAPTARELAEILQKLYLSVGTVVTIDEARRLMATAGLELGPTPPSGDDAPDPVETRAAALGLVMGRLSRAQDLSAVDPVALIRGLDAESAHRTLKALEASSTVAELRAVVKGTLS